MDPVVYAADDLPDCIRSETRDWDREAVIIVPDEKGIEKVYTAFFEQPFPADLKIVLIWLAASLVAIFLPA